MATVFVQSGPRLRKDYPIGPQRVTVQLPLNVKISRVELLRAGTKPQFRQKNGAIEFTIDRVVDYEVAALSKA